MPCERRPVTVAVAAAVLIAGALLSGCGSETTGPDVTPPAAIINLWVQTTGCDNAVLAWSAPGDDGAEGMASSYDVRYSQATITEANWDSATECDGEPTPKAAGLTEQMPIPDLAPSTAYYFACKALDDAGNESELSNNAHTTVGSTSIEWVNDGVAEDEDWGNSASSLSANWADAACVTDYEYAIGTTQGGTDVVGWTSRGTATSVTRSGLALAEGQTYYLSARSVLGIVPGTPTSSDGITVDLTLPASAVGALPAEIAALTFTVTWSGSDAGSGIKAYDVQVSSDQGVAWGSWLSDTTITTAEFTGLNGHTYHFRSRAWDNAGNAEEYPATADAHTAVNLATSFQVGWVNDGLGADEVWTDSTDALSANWPAVSGAEGYEYAIGAMPGGSEVRGWTSVGAATSVTRTGLSLIHGQAYYVSVRVTVGIAHGVAVSSNGITVDTVAPSSSVGALPAVLSVLGYTVTWSGTDANSGLTHYDFQVRDGAGAWQDLYTHTTITQYYFIGELDHTYYFRSRAYDLAGNVEVWPATPDTWTCMTCFHYYSWQWGQQGSGNGDFHYAFDLDVDASGLVYVADSFNGRVQVFDANGNFVRKFGDVGSGDSTFNSAMGVAVDDSGYVYATDSNDGTVKKFTSDGAFVTAWGGQGSGPDQMSFPKGIAVDDSFYVYVAEQDNNRVHKFTSNGVSVKTWGAEGTADGELRGPVSIAVAPSGDIYTVEVYNHRVQQFTPDGVFVRKWGTNATTDGNFVSPAFIAIDSAGHVYVTEEGQCRVQRFTPEGVFLNKWGGCGTSDGQFLDRPYGIAVDADGTVYVTDLTAARILKFQQVCP